MSIKNLFDTNINSSEIIEFTTDGVTGDKIKLKFSKLGNVITVMMLNDFWVTTVLGTENELKFEEEIPEKYRPINALGWVISGYNGTEYLLKLFYQNAIDKFKITKVNGTNFTAGNLALDEFSISYLVE